MTMKQDLLYIDADGLLYRGFGRCYPIFVWIEKERRWTSSQDFGVPPDGWGELVTRAEAERCYPGSTSAPVPEGIELVRELSSEELIRYRPELFDGYDGRVTRHSPEENKRYADATIPAYIKRRIGSKR
jgi:hypothetical protein